MLEQFATPQRSKIMSSLTKLGKAASQGRFRIKSLRVKTDNEPQKQKGPMQPNYEQQISKRNLSKEFLHSLYIIRSQQCELKPSEAKYHAFLRSLYQRLSGTTALNLFACNFQKQSCSMFISEIIKNNKDIITYDISRCTYLNGYTPKTENVWLIDSLLRKDKAIVRLVMKNMDLSAVDIKRVFDLIIENENIFELNMSNDNSQTMNRFSQSMYLLYDFLKENSTVAILNLDNLSIRKAGVDHIHKGILANPRNPLRILSLRNNAITDQASLPISIIVRSGLEQLDISENPLGQKFYMSLPSWKSNTVGTLNLASTDMNSESFIFFLSRVEENKALANLRVDRNDFSHHWFNQIKQCLEINTSLDSLSMVDCKINRMSEVFNGLLHNRYLRRLNVSYNQYQQGNKQLCQLFKTNKTLQELRIRFCGIKAQHFLRMFQALINNTKVALIDISQNLLGEEGAKQIIRTLSRNSTIVNLVTEKVQIPFSLKQEIDQKILTNREIKRNREITTLKRENRNIKKQDVHTWDDLQQLEYEIKSNYEVLEALQGKVAVLEREYDKKKYRFHEIMKQCNEKEKELASNVDALKTKIRDIENEEKNVLRKYGLKQDNIKKQAEKQQESIENLQRLIAEQSNKNRERENQLEEQYQNQKYLQRKKQQKKQQQMKRTGFDASTAILSKRRSKHL